MTESKRILTRHGRFVWTVAAMFTAFFTAIIIFAMLFWWFGYSAASGTVFEFLKDASINWAERALWGAAMLALYMGWMMAAIFGILKSLAYGVDFWGVLRNDFVKEWEKVFEEEE